jgi:hypothetical protein
MASEKIPLLPMTVQGVALVDGTPPTGTIVAAYMKREHVGKSLINNSSGEYFSGFRELLG